MESIGNIPNEPLQTNDLDFWTEKTQPSLAGFHPSIIYYFKLLKSTLKVKRDCEAKGINITKYENIEKELAPRCAKAYLRAGLPILALKALKDNDNIDLNLIDDILKEHLLMVIKDTAEKEWLHKFPTLLDEISYLAQTFNFSQRNMLDFISNLFYVRDLRHYQCALLAGVSMLEKAAESVLHRASITHIILSRYSRDPFFNCKLATLTDVAEELKQCLAILKSPDTDVKTLPLTRKTHLFHITLAVFFSYFIAGYTFGHWEVSIFILKCLKAYIDDQNNQNYVDISIPNTEVEHSNKVLSTWIRYLLVNKLYELMSTIKSTEFDE